MLVAIIAEQQIENLARNILTISDSIDAIEIRLDFLASLSEPGIGLPHVHLSILRNTVSLANKPVIFTLRASDNGGLYQGSELQRLSLLLQLAEAFPDYLDLESTIPDAFIADLAAKYPTIKIIRSYHNFHDTPDNLDEIMQAMQHESVQIYKFITTATSSIDNLGILSFIKQHKDKKLVAHCMGELGAPSRILGRILGNCFTYCSSIKPSEPLAKLGCLSADELINIFNYQNLNSNTKIYALLGDPVSHSVGHIFHNGNFKQHNVNAVYVKFKLKASELELFFTLSKFLPFRGFSVTMPLKEAVVPFVQKFDHGSQIIRALNTLMWKNEQLHAMNTDGLGALQAIQEKTSLESKNILILGAGGTAKAIAHAALRSSCASITILNRTLSKAQEIVTSLAALAPADLALSAVTSVGSTSLVDQSSRSHTIDIVINTLSNTLETQDFITDVLKKIDLKSVTVLNIDYSNPKSTVHSYLLETSQQVVTGLDMFKHQAVGQYEYWANP